MRVLTLSVVLVMINALRLHFSDWIAIAVAGLLLLCSFQLAAQQYGDLSELPDFQPSALTLNQQASYVQADGSIAIVGYNDMAPMFVKLNKLFVESHPDIRFSMHLKGTATAVPALSHGVSAFAPMGAEFSQIELKAYNAIVGEPPLQFRVAHCTLNPEARSAPIAIFVHPANPLSQLTHDQLVQVFSSGSVNGDISRWGQLGLSGEWAQQVIYTAGIAEEQTAGLAMFMQHFKLSGLPFPSTYNAFFQSSDVIQYVAETPAAIGFAAAHLVHAGVKVIALEDLGSGQFYLPTNDTIVLDNYPLNRHLYIYVRKVSGEPFDPIVKEYLRLALSRQGQAAIMAAQPGYLPLSISEAKTELARLEQQK